MVNHQTKKHIEAKNAINALNEFLRRQIEIIKEEGELLLQVMILSIFYIKRKLIRRKKLKQV